MQMNLAFTKMHKTSKKKTPPIVMHLDFAFYIAMHLDGETWHICQRSPAMQNPSLRAVSLRVATTSREREASRVLLRDLPWWRTDGGDRKLRSVLEPRGEPVWRRTDGQQTTNRYGERERWTAPAAGWTGDDGGLFGRAGRTAAGSLARDRLGILHNGWRSPDFSLAIFIWGFAICLKCITSNA